MSPLRLSALLLLFIPLAMLAFMSQHFAFPIVVAAIALVGAWGRIQLNLKPSQRGIIEVVIIIVFTIKFLVLPPLTIGGSTRPFYSIGTINYILAYNIAQGILVWQAVSFFLKQENRSSVLIPLYSALAIVMAGAIPAPEAGGLRNLVFGTGSVALAVITGLYYMLNVPYRTPNNGQTEKGRRRGLVFSSVLLLIVAAAGWGMGKTVYTYGENLDSYLANVFLPRGVPNAFGFPTDGRFGNIHASKERDGDGVALRAFCKEVPGYLRGKVYDAYEPPRWINNAETQPLTETILPNPPVSEPNIHWFALCDAPTSEFQNTMTIELASSLNHVIFAPLDAEYLGVFDERLSVDAHGIPQGAQASPGTTYHSTGATSPPRAAPSFRKQLLALPETLDPRIPPLAGQLTQDCSNDAEKVLAIIQYLGANYEYSLDEGPDQAEDPVAAFLFDTPKGHCEFFASAAAILLRCAGVPCRFVTGFVAVEKNPFGKYWIARNKDAHAWVEADIEGEGWTVVEATPAGGIPTGEVSQADQFWDYVKHLVRSFIAAVRNKGFWASIAWLVQNFFIGLWQTVFSRYGLTAIGLLAVIIIALLRRKRRRNKWGANPEEIQLRRLLEQMDRRLAKQGFVRHPSETLHRFATRIESHGQSDAATWYRTFAEFRYGGSTQYPTNYDVLKRLPFLEI